jgi:hypothetical protein
MKPEERETERARWEPATLAEMEAHLAGLHSAGNAPSSVFLGELSRKRTAARVTVAGGRPRQALNLCQAGFGHRAEIIPGTRNLTYLYAHHSGALIYACAEHSGLCHQECWPEGKYPDLRRRTQAGLATAGQDHAGA